MARLLFLAGLLVPSVKGKHEHPTPFNFEGEAFESCYPNEEKLDFYSSSERQRILPFEILSVGKCLQGVNHPDSNNKWDRFCSQTFSCGELEELTDYLKEKKTVIMHRHGKTHWEQWGQELSGFQNDLFPEFCSPSDDDPNTPTLDFTAKCEVAHPRYGSNSYDQDAQKFVTTPTSWTLDHRMQRWTELASSTEQCAQGEAMRTLGLFDEVEGQQEWRFAASPLARTVESSEALMTCAGLDTDSLLSHQKWFYQGASWDLKRQNITYDDMMGDTLDWDMISRRKYARQTHINRIRTSIVQGLCDDEGQSLIVNNHGFNIEFSIKTPVLEQWMVVLSPTDTTCSSTNTRKCPCETDESECYFVTPITNSSDSMIHVATMNARAFEKAAQCKRLKVDIQNNPPPVDSIVAADTSSDWKVDKTEFDSFALGMSETCRDQLFEAMETQGTRYIGDDELFHEIDTSTRDGFIKKALPWDLVRNGVIEIAAYQDYSTRIGGRSFTPMPVTVDRQVMDRIPGTAERLDQLWRAESELVALLKAQPLTDCSPGSPQDKPHGYIDLLSNQDAVTRSELDTALSCLSNQQRQYMWGLLEAETWCPSSFSGIASPGLREFMGDGPHYSEEMKSAKFYVPNKGILTGEELLVEQNEFAHDDYVIKDYKFGVTRLAAALVCDSDIDTYLAVDMARIFCHHIDDSQVDSTNEVNAMGGAEDNGKVGNTEDPVKIQSSAAPQVTTTKISAAMMAGFFIVIVVQVLN